LGWWQFEQLCQTILQAELGLTVEVWGGHSDRGHDAYVEGDLDFPVRGKRQRGPFVFQAKFVADSKALGRRAETRLRQAVKAEILAIQQRKSVGLWGTVRCYVLMTNVRLRPGFRTELQRLIGQELTNHSVVLLGDGELSTRLNAAPQIRSSFPQILSLRDLGALIEQAMNRGLSSRTYLMLEHARELAPVFVPTGAYRRALSALSVHGLVVLTGPPELGKTTIAETIALARSTEGWEVFSCDSPADFFSGFSPDRTRPQLFVADDAFGTTEYDPDRSEAWAREMHRILLALRKPATHVAALVWTSRPEPFNAALQRLREAASNDSFPDPSLVLVDASMLEDHEKALMLYRHAKAAGLSADEKSAVRDVAINLISSPHFTPDRISRFATSGLRRVLAQGNAEKHAIQTAALAELSQATSRMQNAYAALRPEHKALLFSLLEADTSYGGVSESALEEAFMRHAPDAGVSAIAIAQRLADHFIRLRSLPIGRQIARVYSWVHPTWRDLVIENLSIDTKARRQFIERSGFRGFSLAISTRGGTQGQRRLPLLQVADDWDAWRALTLRLAQDTWQSPWSLLKGLDEAHKASVDPNERAQLRTTAEAVLPVLRKRWSRAIIPNIDLEAYWVASERLDPIPPSPPLRGTWEQRLVSLRHHITQGVPATDSALAAIQSFVEFVRLVQANEPRFLRQQRFPLAYADLLESLAALLRDSVEDLEEDDEAESEELDRLHKVIMKLPVYVPLTADARTDLLDRIDATLDQHHDVYDRDSWEPDADNDAPGGRSSQQQFSVEALFDDL
jgi:hypothetical protein